MFTSVLNIYIAPAKFVCLGFYVVLFFENERRVGDNDFLLIFVTIYSFRQGCFFIFCFPHHLKRYSALFFFL